MTELPIEAGEIPRDDESRLQAAKLLSEHLAPSSLGVTCSEFSTSSRYFQEIPSHVDTMRVVHCAIGIVPSSSTVLPYFHARRH